MIEKTYMDWSDRHLHIQQAMVERDGTCQTTVVFMNEKLEESDPISINQFFPPGADPEQMLSFCTMLAQRVDAVAFILTTNVWMVENEKAKMLGLFRKKDETDEEKEEPDVDFGDIRKEDVENGVAQFLAFHWGAGYIRFSKPTKQYGINVFTPEGCSNFEPTHSGGWD